MRIDFASLAFGYKVLVGGGTPNWATALGQGKDHKINDDAAIDELLKGITYCSVPVATVSTKVGKGGNVVSGASSDSPIVLAGCFSKVYINDVLVKDGSFVLLVTKELSGVHQGRLRLKYGPSNTFNDGAKQFTNSAFFETVRKQFELASDACWFVSDIGVVNQDELVLKTTFINKNGTQEYQDTSALHEAWDGYYLQSAVPTALVVADAIGSLSVKELGKILKDMYSKATKQATAVHMFGVKYAPIILDKKYKLTDITNAAELGDTKYGEEIRKGINIYKSILENQYGVRFYNKDDKNNANSTQEDDSSHKYGDNIIFYGVPGCGKSHTIKTDYCDDERYMERVVFHPDYTYSDFVGQILPENVDGHISYPFVPGPFTRILKKAVKDPQNNYYLVIEELNRGNAPAIFGEVFQLLDRVNGVSEYGISNEDIASEVYDDPSTLVKIPCNLFILATMNTADQNVFTLDTAFKRRWRMKSITSDMSKCSFANDNICDSNVTWRVFLDTVNPLIIEYAEHNLGSEDKRLGAYFVKMQELKDKDYFSEKVLMYLWNDAFKYDHGKIFDTKYKTLDELLSGFKKVGFNVFNSGLNFQTILDTIPDSLETDDSIDNSDELGEADDA